MCSCAVCAVLCCTVSCRVVLCCVFLYHACLLFFLNPFTPGPPLLALGPVVVFLSTIFPFMYVTITTTTTDDEGLCGPRVWFAILLGWVTVFTLLDQGFISFMQWNKME